MGFHECALDGTPSFHLAGCYHHLKDRLRHGAHLTAEELAFVGFATTTRSTAGGWREINTATYELRSWEVNTETAADMAGLMSVGTRRDGIECVSDGWYWA